MTSKQICQSGDDMNNNLINQKLLELTQQTDPSALILASCPKASELVVNDPYAFCIAACLDRGAKSEMICTIPYWMKERLGHLDPFKINQMSLDELSALVNSLPKKPRFVHDTPLTIRDITKIVVEKYQGNAALIWTNKSAYDVKRVFLSVHGVGTGISNMILLLIEKIYHIRFSDLDHQRMDIKPDVHTKRVLYRLGVAAVNDQNDEAISAAQQLNPSFPGEIDGALWLIGRQWCTNTNPTCSQCPMLDVCAKVDVNPGIAD